MSALSDLVGRENSEEEAMASMVQCYGRHPHLQSARSSRLQASLARVDFATERRIIIISRIVVMHEPPRDNVRSLSGRLIRFVC
jgi:hypothetical protein